VHHLCRWRAPHAVVRLLRTRGSTPKEHDSWARAPVLEAGPLLVLVEVKRRTIAGGGVPLTRRTGPLLSAKVERRSTASGGVLLTRRFAFSVHGDRCPRSMTCGPRPPCQRLGHFGAHRSRSSAELRGISGRILLLKRDSPKRSHSHQRPFGLELSALLCRRSCHGLVRPSRAPPARGGTQLGVQPARVGVLTFAGRIRVGVSPYGDLAVGEFVFFISKLPSGLALPIPSFFVLLLGGAWPPAFTRYALLHPSGDHHRLPPWDAHGGDAPSRFFLQHSGGRMFTSLVKVDSGLSHSSFPRAPNSLGWEASRAAAPSLWL
jgi:hypothetical protein